MDFSGLNKVLHFSEWLFNWLPTKNAQDIRTTALTIEQLEPIINKLIPPLTKAVQLLQPAIKEGQKVSPEVIKIWKEMQPSVLEAITAIPVLVKAWPDIMQAYKTAQPAINAVERIMNYHKAKGLNHQAAMQETKDSLEKWLESQGEK